MLHLEIKYIHTGQTEMLCSHLGNAYSILTLVLKSIKHVRSSFIYIQCSQIWARTHWIENEAKI